MSRTAQPFLLRAAAAGLVALLPVVPAAALEADVRLKWFSTFSALPAHDAQRAARGTPAKDHSLDLRLMFNHQAGPVRLLLEHTTVALQGDAVALAAGPDPVLDQVVTEDARRRWDLTWEIEDGSRHRSLHRLDRAAVQWQPGDWSVTLGRQAVSWGSGIVFQPMDLFSPFAPTTIDRDYKAGDDVVLVDRLLPNGHDLQLLHVMRRDADGDATRAVTSTAFKWHGFAGGTEFELVGAEHYDEPVLAASVRMPAGQALLRVDAVASRGRDGDYRYSGVVNADVSFLVAGRNGYVFAEYFRNGWGVKDLPPSATLLPQPLLERLERGELFNVMRNYLAAGGTYEWHPLVSQSVSLLSNLHDGSSLLQSSVSWVPDDSQSVQAGIIAPLGRAGDEFGGVPLLGDALTTGGGRRVFLRWVYFW